MKHSTTVIFFIIISCSILPIYGQDNIDAADTVPTTQVQSDNNDALPTASNNEWTYDQKIIVVDHKKSKQYKPGTTKQEHMFSTTTIITKISKVPFDINNDQITIETWTSKNYRYKAGRIALAAFLTIATIGMGLNYFDGDDETHKKKVISSPYRYKKPSPSKLNLNTLNAVAHATDGTNTQYDLTGWNQTVHDQLDATKAAEDDDASRWQAEKDAAAIQEGLKNQPKKELWFDIIKGQGEEDKIFRDSQPNEQQENNVQAEQDLIYNFEVQPLENSSSTSSSWFSYFYPFSK